MIAYNQIIKIISKFLAVPVPWSLYYNRKEIFCNLPLPLPIYFAVPYFHFIKKYMEIINSVYILCILKTVIYQWRWWNEIKIAISNGLKEMNVFINKIETSNLSVKRQRRYGVTERTNELTRSQITSNINLLLQWNEWVNLLIQQNEPNLF